MFDKKMEQAYFAVSQFVEITNSDKVYAEAILRDVDYDLEAALTIFFSGQEAEADPNTAAAVAEMTAGLSLNLRDNSPRSPEKLVDFEGDRYSTYIQGTDNNSQRPGPSSSTANRTFDPTAGGRYENFEAVKNSSASAKSSGVPISWPADTRYYERLESLHMESRTYGIIVRQEPDYAVIWSVENQFICAAGYGRRQNVLGGWVSFKSFVDYCLTVEAGLFRRSAYDVASVPARRITHVGGTIVKCQAIVRLIPRSANEVFQMARDDVFGVVLCSFDAYLTKRLKSADCDDGVEVLIIWMENYQRPTNWIAIGVNHGDNDWRKVRAANYLVLWIDVCNEKKYKFVQLEKLPDRVDEMAKKAFAELRRVDDTDESSLAKNIMRDMPVGQLYRPPANWRGFVQVSERQINDVLGVVFCHEANNSISVIYTVFGLARFPSHLELGTWLRMSIHKDVDGAPFPNSSVLSRSHFHVRQSDVIASPLATRVITADGADRLLLCGIVTYIAPRCFENVYLGKVFDKKQQIMMSYDSNTASYTRGFLVEFSLFQKNSNWFCNILKCHGNADGTDHVTLESSVFPDYVGRVYREPASPESQGGARNPQRY